MADDLIELDEIAEARAYQAKEVQVLLNHPAVKAALAATEAQLIAEWKRAPSPLEREMAWHGYQALAKFQTKLRAFAQAAQRNLS